MAHRASMKLASGAQLVNRAARAGVASVAAMSVAFAAQAADVKLGSDAGGLVFEPAEITISKGDSVTWINNRGTPHNVVFDEDDVLSAAGEKHTAKFDVAGEYGYYCEPHQGAGKSLSQTPRAPLCAPPHPQCNLYSMVGPTPLRRLAVFYFRYNIRRSSRIFCAK